MFSIMHNVFTNSTLRKKIDHCSRYYEAALKKRGEETTKMPPGVDFADYVSTDASTDMDRTENLDEEDVVKLVADTEQVSEDGHTDANVDCVLTVSEVMDTVGLPRQFEEEEKSFITLASYESCIFLIYYYRLLFLYF